MNRLTLFQTGAIVFIIVGTLHLMAHFGMTFNQEPIQPIMDMQSPENITQPYPPHTGTSWEIQNSGLKLEFVVE